MTIDEKKVIVKDDKSPAIEQKASESTSTNETNTTITNNITEPITENKSGRLFSFLDKPEYVTPITEPIKTITEKEYNAMQAQIKALQAQINTLQNKVIATSITEPITSSITESITPKNIDGFTISHDKKHNSFSAVKRIAGKMVCVYIGKDISAASAKIQAYCAKHNLAKV